MTVEEFVWSDLPEPHRSRNKAILVKYKKEITALFGYEPKTKWIVGCIWMIQMYVGLIWINSDAEKINPTTWRFWAAAYIIGATISQALFLAIHELAHHLGFRVFLPNRLLALLANTPIIIPFAVSFKGYHLEHHRYQGTDTVDMDLPTKFEADILDKGGFLGKLFFLTFQILFYALRPVLCRYQSPTLWHGINVATQVTFISLVYYYFGINSLAYFLASALLAGSIHPCAAHFISEHYTLGDRTGEHETFSYYGPLNMLTFNVGYHVEHHDFPFIPWSRLPMVRKIAPEFYDNLPHYDSWVGVMWQFLTNDNATMYDRVKRKVQDKVVSNIESIEVY